MSELLDLFDKYTSLYVRGEMPDAADFLRRAGAEEERLAGMLAEFDELAPPATPTPEALRRAAARLPGLSVLGRPALAHLVRVRADSAGVSIPLTESGSIRVPFAVGERCVAIGFDSDGERRLENFLRDEATSSVLTRLAIAEARVSAQPNGLWAIDGALEAIALVDRLAAESVGCEALVRLAEIRTEEAVAVVVDLPTAVLVRAEPQIHAAAFERLSQLRDRVADNELGRAFDDWREAVEAEAREPLELAQGLGAVEEVVYADAGRRELRLGRKVIETNLVYPEARLELREDGDRLLAELTPRAPLAAAYRVALAADEALARPTATELDLLAAEYAAVGVASQLNVSIAAGVGKGIVERFPTVWLNLFEPESRIVVDAVPMTFGEGEKLTASLPANPELSVLPALSRLDRVEVGRELADSLLAAPAHRDKVLAALRELAERIAPGSTRDALSKAVRWMEEVEGMRFDSTAGRLLDGCRAERRIITREVTGRGDFETVTPDERHAVVASLRGRAEQLAALANLIP